MSINEMLNEESSEHQQTHRIIQDYMNSNDFTRTADDFKQLAVLGKGGGGEASLGLDLVNGMLVVIKTMKAGEKTDKEIQEEISEIDF
jgi:serine/threonine protein kinase